MEAPKVVGSRPCRRRWTHYLKCFIPSCSQRTSPGCPEQKLYSVHQEHPDKERTKTWAAAETFTLRCCCLECANIIVARVCDESSLHWNKKEPGFQSQKTTILFLGVDHWWTVDIFHVTPQACSPGHRGVRSRHFGMVLSS